MEIDEIESLYVGKAGSAYEAIKIACRALESDLREFGKEEDDSPLLSDLRDAVVALEMWHSERAEYDQQTQLEVDYLGTILERDCDPQDKMFSDLGEDTYFAMKSLHRKLNNGEILLLEDSD